MLCASVVPRMSARQVRAYGARRKDCTVQRERKTEGREGGRTPLLLLLGTLALERMRSWCYPCLVGVTTDNFS